MFTKNASTKKSSVKKPDNTSVESEVAKCVNKFLSLWKQKQWRQMLPVTQKTWLSLEKLNADLKLQKMLSHYNITSYKITSVKKYTEVVYDVSIKITYKITDKKTVPKKIVARVLCEIKPYIARADGKWGVNPVSILKNLN